jgi:hypothetical protein
MPIAEDANADVRSREKVFEHRAHELAGACRFGLAAGRRLPGNEQCPALGPTQSRADDGQVLALELATPPDSLERCKEHDELEPRRDAIVPARADGRMITLGMEDAPSAREPFNLPFDLPSGVGIAEREECIEKALHSTAAASCCRLA